MNDQPQIISTLDASRSTSSLVLKWVNMVGPLLALFAVYGLFAWLAPQAFTSTAMLQAIAIQSTFIGIGAIGMTLIIVMGGIDLSAGSVVALCSVVTAWMLDRAGAHPLAAAVCGIGAGSLCGFINGALITGLRVVPFIVTLGMLLIVRGVAYWVAQQQKINPPRTILNELLTERLEPLWLMPPAAWLVTLLVIIVAGLLIDLNRFGSHTAPAARISRWAFKPVIAIAALAAVVQVWLAFPPGVFIMLLLATGAAGLLRYTRLGRHAFAIGSNEQTARLCGVRVNFVKIIIYTLGSTMVGVSGLMMYVYETAGNPSTGQMLELDMIAAVVIGGGSLAGGEGSILGSMVGALMLTVIMVGGSIMGMENYELKVVTGAIIIVAVALDRLRHRRSM